MLKVKKNLVTSHSFSNRRKMGRDRKNRNHQVRDFLDQFHGRRGLRPVIRPPVRAVRVRANWPILQISSPSKATSWTARGSRQCLTAPHAPQASVHRGAPSWSCKSGSVARWRLRSASLITLSLYVSLFILTYIFFSLVLLIGKYLNMDFIISLLNCSRSGY